VVCGLNGHPTVYFLEIRKPINDSFSSKPFCGHKKVAKKTFCGVENKTWNPQSANPHEKYSVYSGSYR
jgi:hypothetical protein